MTEVVQPRPQLFVVEKQLPEPLHAYAVQNEPVPASVAEAPQAVPEGAYVNVQLPSESHRRPQMVSPLLTVPAVARLHLPELSHARHEPAHALSQQKPPTQ
jgi:hypothetical protein